jgi:hypothetical protein
MIKMRNAYRAVVIKPEVKILHKTTTTTNINRRIFLEVGGSESVKCIH